jgi:multiple sugar transport system substrate-binding protein
VNEMLLSPVDHRPAKRPRWPALGLLAAVASLTLALTACDGPSSSTTPATSQPLAGGKFRLLVVDDPALATAAERLRGEWNAQTGADFEIRRVTEKDLAAAMSKSKSKTLDADGIICSSAMLGPLAAQELVAPLPEKLLRGSAGAWADIFDLEQLREAAWGRQVVAVPLGSPVLVCYYRADLLEKLGRQPPQTWQQYQELAELLGDRKPAGGKQPWHGAVEPLGPGWAGVTLLARAASYAKHRDNYSTLFDINSMEPLVAGPPFVRALEELVATAKQGPAEQLQFDPAAVRAEFWQGHCGLALSWPTAAGKSPLVDGGAASAIRVGFAELPASSQAYNVGNKAWEPLGEGVDPHVPLLGAAGRLGMVCANTQHPAAVFQLLLWLSGEPEGSRVCGASPATTLFRRSQVASSQQWTEKAVSPAAAAQYAALTERTLKRGDCLLALRLPGRSDYLSALDEAVQAAVRGDLTPAAALDRAATRWRETTQRLGLEGQRQAYLHSLGLE